jgi:hypothetical protein
LDDIAGASQVLVQAASPSTPSNLQTILAALQGEDYTAALSHLGALQAAAKVSHSECTYHFFCCGLTYSPENSLISEI